MHIMFFWLAVCKPVAIVQPQQRHFFLHDESQVCQIVIARPRAGRPAGPRSARRGRRKGWPAAARWRCDETSFVTELRLNELQREPSEGIFVVVTEFERTQERAKENEKRACRLCRVRSISKGGRSWT